MALTVASTREKVIMIEAGAKEVPENIMIDAIFKAHEVNQEIIKFHRHHRSRVRQAETFLRELCSSGRAVCSDS